MGKRIVGNRKI